MLARTLKLKVCCCYYALGGGMKNTAVILNVEALLRVCPDTLEAPAFHLACVAVLGGQLKYIWSPIHYPQVAATSHLHCSITANLIPKFQYKP